MMWTIENTKALLTQRAKDLSGDPCPECEADVDVDGDPPEGWFRVGRSPGIFRRCRDCETRLIHPWLAGIDAERACAWLNEHHQEDAFALDELKVLL